MKNNVKEFFPEFQEGLFILDFDFARLSGGSGLKGLRITSGIHRATEHRPSGISDF